MAQDHDRQMNHKAVLAFALGILSIIVPGLGLFLGIMGWVYATSSIREIESSTDTGMSLALAGKVLSTVGAIIHGLLILLLIVSYTAYVGAAG